MKKEKKLIWKGDLHYYTYKTESEKIERFRRLATLFEKKHNDLFKEMSFIYESIRALVLNEEYDFVEPLEKQSDALFLDIFKYCWDSASSLLSDKDYIDCAKSGYDRFAKVVSTLIKKIDSSITLPLSPDILPKYATRCQV